MDNKIDFALMAGASYISNRHEINKFTIPQGWEKITTPDSYFRNPSSGFEAISFVKGTEIVISFAGTNFDDKTADFFHGNVPLTAGALGQQLIDAARVGRTRLQCAV